MSDRDSYRPGLDGIRALAVVAVLWFHLDRLPGGNLGVDAFFVLSGWLITWRLLAEADRSGSISLASFWSARVRRIVPASLAVLLAISIVWPLANIEVPSLRRDLVWAAGWMSNWGTISGGGDYWARFGEVSPVTHYWSLAIEEQFYVVWPLVVLALVRSSRLRRVAVGGVSAIAAIGSIVFMNVTFDASDATSTYMNTFARAHSLLIGAAAAAITCASADGSLRGGRAARRVAPLAAVVAAAIIVLSSEQSTWMFRFGFPVFALAMAIVVVAVADGAGVRILASPPLRWLGDRSYGLYLWHWPIFLLLSPDRLGASGAAPTVVVDLARVTVAVVLADLSYRLVEQPVRRRRPTGAGRVLVAAGASAVVVALFATVLVSPLRTTPDESVVTLAAPPSSRPPTTGESTIVSESPSPTHAVPSTAPTPTESAEPTTGSAPASSTTTDVPAPASSTTTDVPAATSIPIVPPPPLRVLVTGDSTGVQLAEALLAYADDVPDELVVGSAAYAGCGLSAADDGRLHEFTNSDGRRELIDLGDCLTQWASIGQRIDDEAIDAVVVYIGPWDAVDIHLVDGTVVSVGDAIGARLVADSYGRFADVVAEAGASLVWVTPADTHLGWGEIDDPLNDPVRWTALRSIIDDLDAIQIDLPGWLRAEGLEGPDGRPDGVHLPPELNARFVAEVVAPTLAAMRHDRASQPAE